jgi:thioredoxin 1
MQLTKNNFEKEVIEHKGIVLVDFYADWCGPCIMLKEELKTIEQNHKDLKICKINIDEEQELAIEFGVMSIPTVYIYKDGKPINNFLGYRPANEIEELLKNI